LLLVGWSLLYLEAVDAELHPLAGGCLEDAFQAFQPARQADTIARGNEGANAVTADDQALLFKFEQRFAQSRAGDAQLSGEFVLGGQLLSWPKDAIPDEPEQIAVCLA